jgi:hypothetical protein
MLVPPHREEKEYFEALGRFVESYANVEQSISGALWSFSGLKSPIARALLSGVRAEGAGQYLSRIFEVKRVKREIKQEFETINTQLLHITKVRNLLHHHETLHRKNARFVTNKRVALNRKRLRKHPISAKILKRMTDDLDKIAAHFTLLVFRNDRVSSKQLAIAKHVFARELDASWRYKPPPGRQLKSKRRKIQDGSKGPIPSAPPPASRA